MYQSVFVFFFSALSLCFSGILCFSYCSFGTVYNELTFNIISLHLFLSIRIIYFVKVFKVKSFLLKFLIPLFAYEVVKWIIWAQKSKKKSVYIVYRVFVLLGKNEIMQFSLVELQSG